MAESDSVKYLLIGGGAAVAAAAVGIREVDPDGSVLIVNREPRLPYDRPPLSKGFLSFKPNDPEDIESKDGSFYTDKNIQVRTDTEAIRLDRQAKRVTLSDGSLVSYDKLLLATGASPNPIHLKGSDLENVFLFRSVDDALAVREAAKSAENVALIGAGFIGMEVGASLRQLGKSVTIIDPSKHPFSKFTSPITGSFLTSFFENEGIRFIFEDEAHEIGGSSRAEIVRTKSGHATPADLVVIGVGVSLNNQLAKDSGLELGEKGAVKANEFLQTESDPDIYVAGDLAAYRDILRNGKQWHIEHYMHAKWSGNQAGRNMAGAREEFRKVPYFFSDMFDLMMVLRGDPTETRAARVLGDVDTSEFVELYTAPGDDTVQMAIGFTKDGNRYDPIVDSLEAVILAGRQAHSLGLGDVGLG